MHKVDSVAYEPTITSERVWRIIVQVDARDSQFCGSNIHATAALTLQYVRMGPNASIFNAGYVDMTPIDGAIDIVQQGGVESGNAIIEVVCGYFLATLSPIRTFQLLYVPDESDTSGYNLNHN